MRILRIAVLKADVLLPEITERFGDYGPIYKRLLLAGARHIDFPERNLEIKDYDVIENPVYPKLEDVDAIVISGSKFNSFDDTPWILQLVAFTQHVLAQSRVRLAGFCFGHQIIGRALGAPVGRSPQGWELSVSTFNLTPDAQKRFGKPELKIHQFHRDIIVGCPAGVECWGSSPLCENQAMYAPKRLLSVQGHPEFTGPIVTILLEARHEKGVIKTPLFEDAMGRVNEEHDGEMIGGVVLKFLLEGW